MTYDVAAQIDQLHPKLDVQFWTTKKKNKMKIDIFNEQFKSKKLVRNGWINWIYLC